MWIIFLPVDDRFLKAQSEERKKTMYEKYDSYIGTIISVTPKGCYVDSDNDLNIRGFYFGGGRIGDRVLCTVKRVNSESSLLLSLDSVISFAPLYFQYADVA